MIIKIEIVKYRETVLVRVENREITPSDPRGTEIRIWSTVCSTLIGQEHKETGVFKTAFGESIKTVQSDQSTDMKILEDSEKSYASI